jgi:hypothetical protein
MPLPKKIVVVLATALSYLALYRLNFLVIGDSFNYSHRVDWLFLPSGLRLAFILIFVGSGALGIVLASTYITFVSYGDGAISSLLVSGSLAGITPLVAREVAVRWLRLERELENLRSVGLVKLAFLFAAVSSLIHQLWYFWNGTEPLFIESAVVRFIGDLLGSIVVLGTLQLVIQFHRYWQGFKNGVDSHHEKRISTIS